MLQAAAPHRVTCSARTSPCAKGVQKRSIMTCFPRPIKCLVSWSTYQLSSAQCSEWSECISQSSFSTQCRNWNECILNVVLLPRLLLLSYSGLLCLHYVLWVMLYCLSYSGGVLCCVLRFALGCDLGYWHCWSSSTMLACQCMEQVHQCTRQLKGGAVVCE